MADQHDMSERDQRTIDAEPWIPIGDTGLDYDGMGYVRDEWLEDLRGEKAPRRYREMAENNSICGSYVFSSTIIAQKTPRTMTPADDTNAAQFIADRIDEMFGDMSHTWEEFISDAMSEISQGYALHEVIYKVRRGWNPGFPELHSKYDDGLIGIRKMPIRHQETLKRWEFQCDGGILGVYQQAPPDYTETFIPLSRSALFRTRSNKNSPQGFSLFRPAYRPWYFLKRAEEYEMIGIARDMAGLLALRLPPEYFSANATPKQKQTLANMRSLVQKIRRGEYEGLVYPAADDAQGKTGYEAHLLQSGGRRPMDTDPIIRRLESRIAIAVLGEAVLLGMQGNVGAWSLADMKVRMSTMALNAILAGIASVINRFVIPRIVAANHWDLRLSPTIEFGEIDTTNLVELMPALAAALQSGMIGIGPMLEEHVRTRLGIPMEETPSIGQMQDGLGAMLDKPAAQQEVDAADAAEEQLPIAEEKSASVSVSEIADLFGISRSRVNHAIDRGQLPGFKIGNTRMVLREDFDAWRSRTGQQAAA